MGSLALPARVKVNFEDGSGPTRIALAIDHGVIAAGSALSTATDPRMVKHLDLSVTLGAKVRCAAKAVVQAQA
jgi:hypothetical protein